MYSEIKMIALICDNCKEYYEESHNGHAAFADEGSCNDSADDDGWYLHNDNENEGKHYCPLCAKTDDDDNLIIDKSRFKEK